MIQVVYLYPLFASLVFSLAIQSKRVTKLTRRCSNNARQWVGNKPLCRRQAAATYRGGGGRVGLGGLEIACADESHFSFGRQIINFLLHHFNRLSVPDHRRPKLQL